MFGTPERTPSNGQCFGRLRIQLFHDLSRRLRAAQIEHRDIATNPSVLRLMALSGGYPRHEATEGLALNYGMIASFSRALLEGLRVTQDDNEFDRVLMNSVQEIYAASIT